MSLDLKMRYTDDEHISNDDWKFQIEKTEIPLLLLEQLTEIGNLTAKLDGKCNRYKICI